MDSLQGKKDERDFLRKRAWQQRTQETQPQDLHIDPMPLFGEPFKTNKGDELSQRIERIFGRYEDGSDPHPLTAEPPVSPTSVTFSQSNQGQPNTNQHSKLSLHNQVHDMSTQLQKGPSDLRESVSRRQPNTINQKPTAYVRPMDGPDQVVDRSPRLKPSPEPDVLEAQTVKIEEVQRPVDWQLGNWMRSSQTVTQATESQASLQPSIKCEDDEVAIDHCCTDRPKVKTKIEPRSDASRDSKRTLKHRSVDKREDGSEPGGKQVGHAQCPPDGVQYQQYQNPWSCFTQGFALPRALSPGPISCIKIKSEPSEQEITEIPPKSTHKHPEKTKQKTRHTAKCSQEPYKPPGSLLVRIDLRLLSRVPQAPSKKIPQDAKRPAVAIKQEEAGGDASATQKVDKPSRTSVKRSPKCRKVEDNKVVSNKKPKLEDKITSSSHASKLQGSSRSTVVEVKKAKKDPVPLQPPPTPKDTAQEPKLYNSSAAKTQETRKTDLKDKDVKSDKSRREKPRESSHSVKQETPKSRAVGPSSSQCTRRPSKKRPLLTSEQTSHPVEHYMNEAKKLKHKADVESNKFIKALNYMDAAMYFVESAAAMEKEPQISRSSHTMFAQTLELLKFVLTLKLPVDPSASPSGKDFSALCLKAQSLLQMAMFRVKHKTALKYSKTLSDHFTNAAQKPHLLRVSSVPSPNVTSQACTGRGLVAERAGGTVAVSQTITQATANYINITTLFLEAHDGWEQAEELAQTGSGLLAELDEVVGPLSLMSSMRDLVRYTRQGVHWLRLDTQKKK